MTIEAELPDGTVLEFPDGTDQSVIQRAVRQSLGVTPDAEPARAIGRAGRAQELQEQRLTEREQFLQSLPSARRALVESIGPVEAAAIAAGRGMMSIGRGVGLIEPEDPFITERFRELEEDKPIATTVGEVAGQSAPFLLPSLGAAGLASTPLRVGAVGALGAAEGGLIARGEGLDVGEQFAAAGIGGTVAGALELGLPILGRLGGKIVRRVTGKAPAGAVVDAAGNPSQELLDALDNQGLDFSDVMNDALVELRGQSVDPEQAARQAFLRSQGIEPTKAQVTQLADDFLQQQELAKRTSKVGAALQRQDATLTTRFNNAVLDTGGTATQPTNTVVDSITEKATTLDNQISDLYKQAREAAPDEKNIKFTALTKELKKLSPQNRKGGYNIESIFGDLKTRGVIDKKGKLSGRVDISTAEEVRQAINQLYDPANGFGNIQLRLLKDRLDDDVFKAAGGDVFKQARKAKASFERDLNRAKVSKFDSRKSNLVRDVLENKVDPDSFTKDVIFSKKWRSEDLTQLKSYLQADDAGKQAFNDLRADTMQEIKDRVFKGTADESGNVTFTRERLDRALKSIGKEKLAVIFEPKEVKFLDDMLKVATLREPVRGTFQGGGPSSVAITNSVNRLQRQLDRLGVVSDIIDKISVNAQGRVVIKPKPDKLIRPISGSQVRQAAALGGGAASTQVLGDEQ